MTVGSRLQPVQRQFSAGGVVFRVFSTGPRIVLISRQGGEIWCLPKGLIELGEAARTTAVREVLEETGLRAVLLRKIKEIQYWYSVKGGRSQRCFKKVSFFLMRAVGGSVRRHDFEVDEARWFPVEKALERMTYPTERAVVLKAKPMIAMLLRKR